MNIAQGLKQSQSSCILVASLQGRRSLVIASTQVLWPRDLAALVSL
jgi:hypothetical protein